MINDVVFVEISIRAWRYTVALLFHLVSYRGPYLSQRPLNEIRAAAYFVTSWVLKSHLGAQVEVEKNYHLCIHGFLHSRDYAVSLTDFLKDAHGPELPVPENLDPYALRAPRSTTEVVAQRIMSQVNGSKR